MIMEFLRKASRLLADKIYLALKYKKNVGKWPNFKNPVTFNEKLQWLKLHDKNPEYVKMVDKHEAKKYVASIIGEEYIIPEYGVWDRFEDIDFDALPEQFVLKTTHDCAGVVICRDKSTFDYESAKKFLNKHLANNYFYEGREWPYKNVKPRIIAEKFMEDKLTNELRDYKIFTFGGEPKILFVATERQSKTDETKFDFFDMDYNHLDIRNGHPNAAILPQKPECFEEMKVLAEKLSQNIPHLRVDFYVVDGKIYFGELTFSHWSGFVKFEPRKWDETLGDWINLTDIKNK